MASRTVRARLDEVSERALATLTAGGKTDSEAVRDALVAAAERARRRSALAVEVARLTDDPVDRAARDAVMADMEALAPGVPE
jgi:hypothetical protein